MRYFYIADNQGRDATVMAISVKSLPNPVLGHKGKKIKNVRILESSEQHTYKNLKKAHGEKLVDAIIKDDVDIDFIKTGLIISQTNRIYLSNEGLVMKQMPKMQEVVFDAKGEEKKRSEPKNIDPNIRDDTPPIKWTGRFFDKKEAIRNFVFQRSLQLQHTNGLTYDFLFNMANDLQEKNQLMFVGAGTKGIEPLIFQVNGTPMRGFLEGRTDGKKYKLLLHLSNMEIKLP